VLVTSRSPSRRNRGSVLLPAALLAALVATLILPGLGRAEVVLVSTTDRRIVGESIRSEDAKSLVLHIYRGYTLRLPKSAVKRRVVVDRSLAAERAEFARRRGALDAKDVSEHVRLAEWAAGQGLVVQSRALLLELSKRFPGNATVRAALPAQSRKKSLSKAEVAFLEKQIKAFFAGPEHRARALAALHGKDTLPLDTADDWAKRCFAAAREGPKVTAGDSTFTNGTLKSPLHVKLWRKKRRPKDAPPDESPWPVVLTLHGGGRNSGHWRLGGPMFFAHFRRHLDKMIFVAPTVIRKRYAEWGGNPDEERQIRAILNAVNRTWKVDTNRVYLCGYSMGGYGTWQIGGHGADRFAGLVSGAGGILIGRAWGWGVVGNLMHTPIAFAHGGKDKPAPPWSDAECDRILRELARENPGRYRHKYLAYPKSGHSLPGSAMANAVKWIVQFRREPYPKSVCWEPNRPFNTRLYWLATDKPELFTRLNAEVERNAVRIRTLNLHGGFRVLLNRHLVDLAKPVTITVNGELVFDGLVQPRLSVILKTAGERVDEAQWFSGEVGL
jgi:predicted esterase